MARADEDELLKRCQHDDDSAMSDLVDIFQDRIFRLSYRVLGDVALAEDATADALAKVWLRCRSWRAESSAGTWIYRIAWRSILDQQRGRTRWSKFWGLKELLAKDNSLEMENSIASQEEQADKSKRLSRALDLLSNEERAVMHMYYFEQKSLLEISQIVGTSRNTLKMRLSRIRKKLRGLLEENE